VFNLIFRNFFFVKTSFYVLQMPAFLAFLNSRLDFSRRHTIKQLAWASSDL